MDVLQRLTAAQNNRDLDAFVSCFAPDYRSEQPLHPGRKFSGDAQVRENWGKIFAQSASFSARLLRTDLVPGAGAGADGEDAVTAIVEVEWVGKDAEGNVAIDLRGVVYFGIAGGVVRWGRLYVERPEKGTPQSIAEAMDTLLKKE